MHIIINGVLAQPTDNDMPHLCETLENGIGAVVYIEKVFDLVCNKFT